MSGRRAGDEAGGGEAQHLTERERARQSREHEEGEEQRRLGEAGERDFPRGAHALEGRAGVEGRRRREEAGEAEEVGEEYQVAGEGYRRREAS